MITILDMASIYAEKHDLAKKEAMKLLKLQHPNLLNLQEVTLEPSHIPDGLLVFKSEAPDHRQTWKTFCKNNFDLEQLLSIFRMITAGVEHMHANDYIFRDLHPTRIHMNEGVVKWNLIGMPYNFKKLLKD